MFDELRWMIGLNLVLAIWLGMLADSWKGRGMYRWMAIGMLTSVFGLVLLLFMPALPRTAQRETQFGRRDSFGH
jgi:hypothetical protein